MSVEKKAVTFLVSPEAYEKILELKTKRQAGTTSEVIRDALRVLSTMEELKDDDDTVTIQKGNKELKYQF